MELKGAKTGAGCSAGGRPFPGRCTCSPGKFLRSNWRKLWVVLYEDSTLAWFRERQQRRPDGWLSVKESAAAGLVAVSQWTRRVPARPYLPPGIGTTQLLALGRRGPPTTDTLWLLAPNEEEASEWIAAINITLAPLTSRSRAATGVDPASIKTKIGSSVKDAEEAERQRMMTDDTPLSMVGDMAVASTWSELHWGIGKGWLCPNSSGLVHSYHTWPVHVPHIECSGADADLIVDTDCAFDCDIMF